ncbi:hypothetical protein PCIT_a2972 [Pseudoalteromonas citrea]|uniref:Phage tail fibre protein N-terminal domain-containing protein n=2 Tax=Pseudoalteromonas citrea TaxID=43655 RepID=A0AAD4AHX3_9GAMM|nr:phage tail protein [Pseudoalteromonas citrea]KAF7770028.1 hypothetical protein PCIT_a2972 [Pseudoalteromonas citrea]
MSNSQYWTILTRAGREKVLAAIANKHTVKISEFAVGDGQIMHTSDDLSNLKYRSHTSSLKQLTNNNALIEVVGVVPATEGGFYVREAAFYTDDGQAFAIINYPETYKPAAADNAAAELGIKAVIDVVNAQVISEKIDPSVIYATKEWVSDQVDHSELSVLTQVCKNWTFDNGTSTTVNIVADNAGLATLNVCSLDGVGNDQTTGRVYVGQSLHHGGGIEYNGDNNPVTTGAGADYISLFRSDGSGLNWTARNYVHNNDWEFRGAVKSPNFIEGGTSLKDKYLGKTTKAVDTAKLEGKTKAQVISEARNGLAQVNTSPSFKNATFDNGTSTSVNINADNAGMAVLNVCSGTSDAQTTGRVYVGQSLNHGGGIEYNGDNTPATTGAGADYITLFRNSSNNYQWTARNHYGSNDWEFRGAVKSPNFIEAGTSLKDKYHGKSDKLARLESSLFDAVGQDFRIRGKRALVGSEQELVINYGSDWSRVNANGTWRFTGNIERNSHNSGYLVGSHNNVGDNASKTNPIYTIGSGHNPSETELNNMYGIGYTHATANFVPFEGSWGMYVAADGDARIFLDASHGRVHTTGDVYEAGTKLSDKYQAKSDKLARFESSLIDTNGGQDLNIRNKRALVGGLGELIINHGSDWQNVTANGKWQFADSINTNGDITVTKNNPWLTLDSANTGNNNNEQAAGISLGESGRHDAASLHLSYTGDGLSFIGMGNLGSDNIADKWAMKMQYQSTWVWFRSALLIGDGNTVLSKGSNNSLKIKTNHGYVQIGPQNSDNCHYYTDTLSHYFNRKLLVNGEIYAGSNYNKRVLHEGNISSYGEKRTVKASGTLTANSKNHLTATATFTLPDVTNLSEGTTVVTSKAMAVTPTIKTHDSQSGSTEHIAMMRGTTMLTDTSVLFDRHCTLTFILNSAKNWEMQ